MRDETCIELLQWALPRLDKRWPGYRKVRDTVCRRIERRMAELEIRSIDAYRRRIASDPAEREALDRMTRIAISRFGRDRGVFDALAERVLPALAERARDRGDGVIACWSAGCASGEEPYSLAITWFERLAPPESDVELRVLATDVDAAILERARRARYDRSTLKELPEAWIDAAFERIEADAEPYRLRETYREPVELRRQDLREAMPEGPFDLVLCRNLVFTYFAEPLQRTCLARIARRLRTGGFLVIGAHETIPRDVAPLERFDESEPIYRLGGPATSP